MSGQPVPQLVIFDLAMQIFMDSNGIEAGVLGVMKDGRIVYLRGFGWRDNAHTTTLPENAMMRLASVTKPVTAAGIRKLIEWDTIDLLEFAFRLGQPAPGILAYDAFPSLGDSRIRSITVEHLLTHTGGWDRDVAPDLTYREIAIAADMGVASPPGRVNTVRWIMGQPLQVTPGAEYHYSNIGYLLLGLILEQESGMDYISFIRQNVLTESMWFPATEFELGRTFPADRNPREPWYDEDTLGINVFDPYSQFPWVRRPDGSWDHEARVGQGALIASAVMLLLFDSPEFVFSFFGAIKIGAVPIPTNTLLKPPDYEYLLNDSRARVLIISEALLQQIEPIRDQLDYLEHVVVVGVPHQGQHSYSEIVDAASAELTPVMLGKDDACFWLYSSGTTAFPKGAVHLQHDMIVAADLYARPTLGIDENDRNFSVAIVE